MSATFNASRSMMARSPAHLTLGDEDSGHFGLHRMQVHQHLFRTGHVNQNVGTVRYVRPSFGRIGSHNRVQCFRLS